MKQTFCTLLTALLIFSLCACGGEKTENKSPETDTQQTTQTPETESLGPSAELLEAVSPFQGEWKRGEYSKAIVNDNTISFIYEHEISGKQYTSVHTFFFAFSEDGTLVINNKYGQSRKKATILSDGTLQIQDVGDSTEPDIYEWVSASTTVPAEKGDPKIGMTELEVYGSSWGYPKSINKTTTAAGTREQWVYDFGYVYLTNGIVTAIQER